MSAYFSYKEQIRNSILDKIRFMRHLHKRDVKAVIDQVKNEYLFDSKIKLSELKRIIGEYKDNWHELKNEAKNIRKTENLAHFATFQLT